ncbi:MAG: UvrD-helicase domain-containing protein [Planctomycetales bacterium]|nr:UvrD-helicase domain-containing protein [Planctomycetales bacterium]
MPRAVIFEDDWDEPSVDAASMKDDLTPSQRAAVEHFRGPLLVLAGPGSGKTRVITRRIARLIERGVRPWEILAITFTNKAARAMSDRVQALLPGKRIWVSTFHSFCARMLRDHGRSVGLQPNFSIYDTSDQQQIIKQVLSDQNLDAAHFPANKIGARISHAKNELLTPELYVARYGEGIGTHLEAVVAKVYPAYQKRLLAANAVDFDDLLGHVARLLAENEELRSELDQRFRFILVDEYQDTNKAQYQIVAALSQIEPNLCATGDPDQSIYGWRGARIENILRFEQEFPDVTMIRLEENFRSTPEILQTADALISHNVQRKPKRLKTDNASGEQVELRLHRDGQDEANGIANEIAALVEAGERQWKDFAIFYRVNALSRSLETALARQKISYQIAGGVAFYERAEIKDLLGYLRLIENPQDRVAFMRVVNTPTRGIGKSSLDKLVRWADGTGTVLLDAARQPGAVPDLPKKAAVQLRAFAGLIDELAQSSAGLVEALLKLVLRRTGYLRQFESSPDEDDMQRLGNIDELVSAARQYDEQEAKTEQGGSLGGFLETASLAQDIDSLDESTGAVMLMTLHAAKGLEFPVVYVIGVEQNLIPHERSLRENDIRQLEEERRLLFVGITRAEEKLVLTHTQRREIHGRSLSTIPSDFLQELNLKHRDCTGAEDFSFGDFAAHDFADDHCGDDSGDAHDDHGEIDNDASDPDEADHEKAARVASKYAALRQVGKSLNRPRVLPSNLHLTTGAALESGTRQQVELSLGFAVGMQVRHPRYGLGTVIETSGLAKNRMVVVEFATDARRESFVAAKCPLQPIGLR